MDNKQTFLITSGVLTLIVFILDLNMELGVAGGVPYVAVVLHSLFTTDKKFTIYTAVIATILTIVGYFASTLPEGAKDWVILTNRFMAIFGIWMAAFICIRYKQLEQTKQDALHLAALGEFSTHIAHEIKNPIAGIQNVIDIFEDNLNKEDTQYDLCLEVKKQLKGMDNMARDLLSFARQKKPEKITYNLNSLVEEVLNFASHDPVMDGVNVETVFNVESPAIEIDAQMIYQVFLNVIFNAARSFKEAKTDFPCIKITVSKIDSLYEIRFQDNGRGIEEDKLESIFQPFFTTRSRGTGLGLAICMKTINAHKGQIYAESVLGKGSTFTIKLPTKSESSDHE